ncbi:hydantoinase/oxoprolinase family protein [Ruegeria halocynthiae]|uniref:hydantoinase/oxoprolinase family protein n=1 Tax=Ruegeria halocynthiae TaxID=985054 RepID=UPI00056593AE|nr:hydantoinase/oxoprolinase family protein [Ruegeria halocynthiae]
MIHTDGLRLAIDIGGTFTDTVLLNRASDVVATAKTPTTPQRPALGALAGAAHVLDDAGADWRHVTGLIHGTTLATNALIERRGAATATITTHGFRDILEIAYERRYSQYAIDLVKPDLIVPRTHSLTIGGRMDVSGHEVSPLDEAHVAALATELKALEVEAVAICLLHSYANPAHELRLRDLLALHAPDLVVSLSHEVSPEAREFDRLCTTIANAYVQPLMAGYLQDFETRFRQKGLSCPILMMTAGGGMTTLETAARLPIRLVESGPAGGAILAARIAEATSEASVLSFDMGGTTAKLCLIDDFRPQTARKFEISRAERFIRGSGMPVRIPVIEMIEIGAGGGSIASVDRLGRLQVGPHSAGSDPGPAAFGKGGDKPTVTDADLTLGLIEPARFAEGRLKIDPDAAHDALNRDVGGPLALGPDQAAFAISEIVDESMAGAGRMHAVESGKDLGNRLMIAFGGNGPLHATRVARRAQMRRILIPRDPGVGSAVGFLHAPVSYEVIRSRHTRLDTLDTKGLNQFFDAMQAEAEQVVRSGAPDAPLLQRRVAYMRYHGQGHEIEIKLPNRALTHSDVGALKAAFEVEYSRQFSRVVPGMVIEILNWGLAVSSPPPAHLTCPEVPRLHRAVPTGSRQILCDLTGRWRSADVFNRADLAPGAELTGPALIVEAQTTTFVSADFNATVDGHGNIWLTQQQEAQK